MPPIRLSELVQLGYTSLPDWGQLTFETRAALAAQVYRARGATYQTLLVEIGNPVALAQITFVNDLV